MELFVVEITAPPARPRDQSLNHMVTAFKVAEDKASRLLERVERGQGPVTVSRPAPEREALRTARSFQSVGFEVRVRPFTERPVFGDAPSVTPVAVAPPANEHRSSPVVPPVSDAPMVNEVPAATVAPEGLLGSLPDRSSEDASSASFDQPFLRPSPQAAPIAENDPVAIRPDSSLEDALERPEVALDAAPTTIPATAPMTTPARTPGRIGLRRKFLLAAILPTLLTVASAVAAILLTVPGALRGLLLESARNPAIALADGVGGLIPGNALDGKTIGQLQDALNLSRATFAAQNVQFVMVTDAIGNPLAGWYGQEPSLAAVPAQVRASVQTQARRAQGHLFLESNNIMGNYDPPTRLFDAAGTAIEMSAVPIQRNGNTIGTAVVGISSQAVSSRVTSTLITTLLASTLPVILAILIALWLARTITTNVLRLVSAADRISLGELNEPVGLRTNDELNDLGEALERMRISLQESLERLRRRRR